MDAREWGGLAALHAAVLVSCIATIHASYSCQVLAHRRGLADAAGAGPRVLSRVQAEVPVDPQRVQELEVLVGILEAPREGAAGEGAGEEGNGEEEVDDDAELG